MRTRSRLPVALMATAVLMVVAVGAASANTLSLSNARDTASWTAFEVTAGTLGAAKCEVIPIITFHHGTFTKTAGTLIGVVEAVRIKNCTIGQIADIAATLPWHVRYSGFTGTLPNMTTVNVLIVGMGLEITTSGGARCRTTTTAETPARAILNREGRGVITSIRLDETAGIPMEGELLCAGSGEARLSGAGSLKSESGASVLVTLI